MQICAENRGHTLYVCVSGELDEHNAARARMEADKLAERCVGKTSRAVFDLGSVSFMDSSGIAVVINALRHMSRMDGVLYISGLCEQPRKVFCAAGIDKLVKIKEAIF